MAQAQPGPERGVGQHAGLQGDAAGDAAQALRPVPDGVEAGDDRQQHLCGADVGGGLFAADMLLAGLQRQAHRGLAGGIQRHADQAAGHGALERVPGGEEPGMRAAETHRHAEALRRTDDDVGAHLAGRRQQRQRQRVGGDDGQRAGLMGGGDFLRQVAQGAGACRDTAAAGRTDWRRRWRRGRRARPAVRVIPSGLARVASTARVCGCRSVATASDVGFGLAEGMRHRHRLGRGGGLIQQRGVGDLHAGQFADHGLEVQQRLQPALGDLGLIGRVGGVPAGIFQHVAQDDRRRDGAVVAHADQAFGRRVLRRQGAQFGDRGGLIDRRRQVQRRVGADRGGDGLARHVVQRRGADGVQHRRQFGFRRADMAADEAVVFLEFRQFGPDVQARDVHAYNVSRYSS